MITVTLRPMAIGVFVVSSVFMSSLSYAACRTIGKPILLIFNLSKNAYRPLSLPCMKFLN